MKKFIFLVSISTGVALLVSCAGESSQEKAEEKEKKELKNNPFAALAEMGKQMKEGAEASQAKIQERKSRGDTLAINYKELQKYLPSSIEGYKAGSPGGGTLNMTGLSYSSAEIEFTKDNGENVRITLLDYNAAYNLYSMATSAWAMGMSIETDEEKANGMKLSDDITGWETLDKKGKKASVVLGIGYRFLLTVEASSQNNTDFVKSVASSMKLDDLKKM